MNTVCVRIPQCVDRAMKFLSSYGDGKLISTRGLCSRIGFSYRKSNLLSCHPLMCNFKAQVKPNLVFWGNEKTVKDYLCQKKK